MYSGIFMLYPAIDAAIRIEISQLTGFVQYHDLLILQLTASQTLLFWLPVCSAMIPRPIYPAFFYHAMAEHLYREITEIPE